jgi:hypothetical protein
MAASPVPRVDGHADKVEAAVRDALADGNPRAAFNRVLGALQSEASKLHRARPADGALTYAQLAGSLSITAAELHRYHPDRPAGCPRVPGPEHLLAAFEAEVAEALKPPKEDDTDA